MSNPRLPQLPIGTQVVLRDTRVDANGDTVQRGSAGRVAALDEGGRYVVRTPDGREVSCRREQVTLRRQFAEQLAVGDAVQPPDEASLVADHTIYAAVVGSRAYGLATEHSDTDIRGTYVAPTPLFWSLVKPPTHVDGPEPDRFSWEVERFCEVALKANPNLLEVLHSPLVDTLTPLGEELLELRPAFLSQLAYQTYSDYVLSQFKKLEQDFRQRGAPKWKHVMHLLRLLLSAGDLLREGALVIDVHRHRERLLAVRDGRVEWDEVERWRLALHAELDDALRRTTLPAAPDVQRVDAWLRSVRSRSAREPT